VVFYVGNPEEDSTQARNLARVLAERIRSTDEAGWLDNHRIGVFLPDTSAVGAWRLADDICQVVATKSSPPKCTVYTYPSRWLSNNNRHSAQLRFQGASPESATTASPDFLVSAKHSVSENLDLDAQRLAANRAPDRGESTDAFESLLLSSPLPTWKRTMDIVGALCGLILLSPLLLLVTLIIKIVSPGPAFFKQQRVGYMGRTFTMWKFRTMKPEVDTSLHEQHISRLLNNNQPMTKLDDELQIIPFGKILRETCLDELPQLINVLNGEMSLVGPRPPIPYELEEYLCWHNRRVDAVPGLTGLWQVSGKNRLTFDEMVRLDIQYWRNKSLWLDVRILLMTPPAIVSQIKDSMANKELQMKGATEDA
jgi:lipopolysaccharide/colanic/teichoic acid biosynthesis glycosyltransferase